MNQIADIFWRAQQRGELRFIVIGGRGLAAHGIQRYTEDTDLLLATTDHPAAHLVLKTAGFEAFAENDVFSRWRHRELVFEVVDLMRVTPSTFEKMWQDSVTWNVGPYQLHVASIRSYVALKLHALRHNPERDIKDLPDIIALLRAHPTALSRDELTNLCETYGPSGILEKLVPFLPS
jgi:hypothetical protein